MRRHLGWLLGLALVGCEPAPKQQGEPCKLNVDACAAGLSCRESDETFRLECLPPRAPVVVPPSPFCSPALACLDWERCTPTVDGGTCSDLGLSFTWVSPDGGALDSGMNLDFDLRARPSFSTGDVIPNLDVVLTRRTGDGGSETVFPGFRVLPYQRTDPSGAWRYLSTWSTQFENGPLPEGLYEVHAGFFDGGPNTTARFSLPDSRPPLAQVKVERPPLRAANWGLDLWRRGEEPYALVEANEVLADATLRLSADGGVAPVMPAAPLSACERAGLSCVDAGVCRCFRVDTLALPMGVDVTWQLVATAIDARNNVGQASAPLELTRARWNDEVQGRVRAAPALGRDGTLYFGTWAGDGGTTGVLRAIGSDGARLTGGWPAAGVALGRIAGLTVGSGDGGRDLLFVTSTTADGGLLSVIDARSGAVLRHDWRGVSADMQPALLTADEAVAVFSLDDGGASLCRASEARTLCVDNGVGPLTPLDEVAPIPPAVVVGSTVVTGGAALYLSDVTAGGFGAATAVALPLDGGRIDGLAVVGGDVLATGWRAPNVARVTLRTQQVTVFTQNLTGRTPDGFGPPIVDALSSAYGTGPTPQLNAWRGNLLTNEVQYRTAYFTQAPTNEVLGPLAAHYGVINSTLTVTREPLSVAWAQGLSQPVPPLLLDCPHRAGGAGGVLTAFLPLSATRTTQLFSVVVDSSGFDPASAWPRVGFSAQNANNPALPRNGGCP
ncbi:MAG: hypothetical protein JNM69_39190 [Archangium sp.]|nr:hypothetical protein [Archangium sp.]